MILTEYAKIIKLGTGMIKTELRNTQTIIIIPRTPRKILRLQIRIIKTIALEIRTILRKDKFNSENMYIRIMR